MQSTIEEKYTDLLVTTPNDFYNLMNKQKKTIISSKYRFCLDNIIIFGFSETHFNFENILL